MIPYDEDLCADLAQARSIYGSAFHEGLRPDPLLTVDEWADAHRILPQRAAAEHGPWRTSRTPYLKEIMRRLSPSDPTEIVVMMKGGQVGGTEAGNNWLGFVMDIAPGPIMMVQPTMEMVKRTSKQRIAPMIEDCPRLRDKVRDPRARDSGNTILQKEFPGGILVMTGANSPIGLRSTPCRYLFLDEVDGYESDVGGEGDPIKLAKRRTANYRLRRKIFIVSTPTVKGISRIERAFRRSDQRYYHVPCPLCGNFAPIIWENLKRVSEHRVLADWEPTTLDEMGLLCGACNRLIPEHRKTEMLAHGRWVPTAPGVPGVAGYHLSALYAPLGWYSWSEALAELREAKEAGREELKTWTNTTLGEVWDEEGETADPSSLFARREHYNAEVPLRVLLLTAGVDVQDDRLEVEVCGWRTGEESYSITYRVLWGDPDGPEPWAQLDDLLDSTWEREDGARLRILHTCIDTGGHRTDAVYKYARGRQGRGVFATIGRAGAGRPIVSAPSAKRYGNSKRPVKLYTIGTDEAKNLLFARLRGIEPGPGYCHFPQRAPYDEQYFLQLTAEKKIIYYRRGRPIAKWEQIRARNEALDCRVLAHAALCLLAPRWPAIEARSGRLAAETRRRHEKSEPTSQPAQPSEAGPETAAQPAAPRSPTHRRRRRGFVGRWRG